MRTISSTVISSAELTFLPASGGINLTETLRCGQSFLWRAEPDGAWRGVIGGAGVRVWQQGDALACDTSLPPEVVAAYFRLDDPLDAIYATFPPDPVLQQAVEAYRGMRLVRYEVWDAVLSFLCATNTNIPRIDRMLGALAARFGERLADDLSALPRPQRLAASSEGELRDLGLGYRAAYVLQAARKVDSGQFDLDALAGMDYEAAHVHLQALPGVGPKVADCICLFALGHLQAVPVDVWVRRILSQRKAGLRAYRAMGDFAREWLGPYAGYAQQYLFHYERMRNAKACGRLRS
ncbi:MAG: DNA-3-methyladenine glycosylase family protein [Anaerolineae bacterium]